MTSELQQANASREIIARRVAIGRDRDRREWWRIGFLIRAGIVLVGLTSGSVAQAWGGEGHRVVAAIAADHLSPAARALVATLLAAEPGAALPSISTRADDTKTAATSRLHFVNLGEHGCEYDAARDCPGGECVVAAIEQSAARLSDARRSIAERTEALILLTHVVADASQPEHAGFRSDKGGLKTQVRWRDTGTNMHRLYDELLVESHGLAWRALATSLEWRLSPSVNDGSPAHWAEASCRIVATEGFNTAVADDAYLARWRPVVDQQLLDAGMRLASLLNAIAAAAEQK